MGILFNLLLLLLIILLISVEVLVYISWQDVKSKGVRFADMLYLLHWAPFIAGCISYAEYIMYPSTIEIIKLLPGLGYAIIFMYSAPAIILVLTNFNLFLRKQVIEEITR